MYYRLDARYDFAAHGVEGVALDESPDVDVPWTMGIRYPDPVQEPIPCYLDPRSGPVMPDLIIDVPLFSQRLVEVLKGAGVRNLDLYDAVVIDREREKTYSHYKAVNIVGLVSCADLPRSEYLPGYKPPLMKFTKLCIDEARTLGLPLFRLAEDSLVILVSEAVKEAIEASKLVGVRVVSLEDPSAY
ncbi:hypothetical protein [Myxococcus sp. SDU36]|uniref:imm11 family protein n=1 Tax=Myxococcus sp. SDU36 TaxID=2831967 RepID=UPI00254310D2|nr:hypothetical protein [Myxococcus sp. SDU36]WIG95911.1 hypothetical protein KGD87_00040 [Myxococcus sp. SDU36]